MTAKKKAKQTQNETKLSMSSMDVAEDRLEQLKALFPEVFSEGTIDFDKLKQALGEHVDSGPERYGMNWAGKRAAFHNVQTLSTGTLRPVPEESVNFDSTENLIIEGDNLEVLKLLQKSYYGKIKMIYIDPPYNTGNEFIYPDNFKEGLQTYLRFTKQVNEEGIAQTTNKETSGRFHSIWMNMMYPRLYLARNLLRDDGVIFISINDNEEKNLRQLLDEIFGEENFIGNLIWKSRHNVDSRNKTMLSSDHEYIVVYGKKIKGQDIDKNKYSNPDGDSRGPWMSDNMVGLATKEQRPNLHYDLVNPETHISYTCPEKGWRYDRKTMGRLVEEKRILWPKSPEGRPRHKKFLNDLKSELTGFSSLLKAPNTSEGTKEIKELFGENIFDFPKPSDLIRTLVEQGCQEEGIVLDFFSGSGPTAQAVYAQCTSDNKPRKYILVQLPEPTNNPSYPTIAEICKDRVRRVISHIGNDKPSDVLQAQFDLESKNNIVEKAVIDLGFKVLKLDSSNFSLWDGENAVDSEQLEHQLRLYADHVKADRSPLDILYEVLLKTGYPLTAKVVEQTFGKLQAFNVEDGELVVCLVDKVTQTGLRAIIKTQPRQVICLDSAFQHNDQLKTNTVLEMKSHDISFHTV